MRGNAGRARKKSTRARQVASLLVFGLILTGVEAAGAQDASAPESAHEVDAHARQHRGFWLSAGGGGGWHGDLRGAAFYLRFGGTPSEKVLFGGEVLTWFRGDDVALQRVNATATAVYYPLVGRGPARGLFFKGGFGIGTTGDGINTGVGTTLGTGFDFRIGRNLYVTPNADVLTQFFESDTDTQFVFTLGLGFH